MTKKAPKWELDHGRIGTADIYCDGVCLAELRVSTGFGSKDEGTYSLTTYKNEVSWSQLRAAPLVRMVREVRRRAFMENPDKPKAIDYGTFRGKNLSHEVLVATAELYRQASMFGTSSHAVIAEHFRIAPSTAAKRIMAARQRGYLGEAKGNTYGEKRRD
ncbi:MAG: hypothetical protein EBX09_06545 [Actinobacteria bacterium]|nr:hypothetical protein [Actinomycetota bacterium]NCX76677.1 hypothetical protein [Actinomycetota bacterium]